MSRPTAEKHHNWKGGKNRCLDCDKQLTSYTSQRCITCHLASSKARQHLEDMHDKIRGTVGPRKGSVVSQETKDLISQKKKGVSAVWNIGKGHRAWNKIGDGVTTQNKLERAKFRRTVQPQVLTRDNYTCQICEQYAGYLHVDHIKAWADYPELRFELDNCRTLCRACHYYITFKRKLPASSTWGIVNMTKKEG